MYKLNQLLINWFLSVSWVHLSDSQIDDLPDDLKFLLRARRSNRY